MNALTSQDGTRITFDRIGTGAPVVLVSGGSVDKSSNAPLAAILAQQYTVYNYDRRGRGESGDTQPYAIEREIEDIEAVINTAGGTAFLYGSSSGAALALAAARALASKVKKLALWEPPYAPKEGGPTIPPNSAQTYRDLVGAGRHGDAVEFFMAKVVGLPPDFVAFARSQPWWAAQEALAHTLAYDAEIMGDYAIPVERAAAVITPTLVMVGGASWGWMQSSAQTLAGILPNGRYHLIEGQTHDVAAHMIAPVLVEFFNYKDVMTL